MVRILIVMVVSLGVGLSVGRVMAQQTPVGGGEPDSAAERCAALSAAAEAAFGPAVVVTSAELQAARDPAPPPAGSPPWAGPTPAVPAHCEVLGEADEREGAHGQRYAIGFHLRLPVDWNGRFLFQGGGGTDGNIGDALGGVAPGTPTALDRGFAVVSTDAGHDNRTNYAPKRQGTVAFGFDYQARVDYAERSLDRVARIGKALVEAFYGQDPAHAYFFGCSNGGRQGMIFAQRYPEHCDGIVAAAPAFDVPRAAVAEAWDTQTFAHLARQMGLVDENDEPLLHRTFSDDDLALVAQAVLEACDADDGAADGMVGDFVACTAAKVAPKLAERTCAGEKADGCLTGEKADGCLTGEQVAALERVFAGPTNATGEPLYSDWAWDAGIGGKAGAGYNMGWRMWKIGLYTGEPFRYPINVTLGSPALSALFVTPPVPVPDDPQAHLAFQLGFSMDADAPKIFATTPAFPRSSWDLIAAKSTDLAAFRERGGKMIVPHGVSDPIFSIHDTRRWWEAVDAAAGGGAASFVRMFAVPGMAHCSGGPATDRYDGLAAIVDWVERGVAPDRIEAAAGEMTPWPNRTRPLCPYPQVARYTGSGSIEDAHNFECR